MPILPTSWTSAASCSSAHALGRPAAQPRRAAPASAATRSECSRVEGSLASIARRQRADAGDRRASAAGARPARWPTARARSPGRRPRVTLRPCSLLQYSAPSASRISASASPARRELADAGRDRARGCRRRAARARARPRRALEHQRAPRPRRSRAAAARTRRRRCGRAGPRGAAGRRRRAPSVASTRSPAAWPREVVDRLEVVDVDQRERQRALVARGAGDLGVQALLEGAVVGEPGERVGERAALEQPPAAEDHAADDARTPAR